ncbi:potassium channel protein [Mycoplasmopsis canis UF31]|uniref:potassium channel family protein n=1 Tax=Mycoplasmopsis canis TaxID=29555 RepID=UPI00025AE8CB|nr:potassium channel family protein [Mycoplasmopsis canis]EIE39947.1 potassium channel protein [Mycoplasmopsis canis UF31]
MKINLRQNYTYLHDQMTSIVWNEKINKENFNPIEYKFFRLFRNAYLILVTITCLLSLLTLFTPIQSIEREWNITISILQIFSFFFFIFDYVAHLITYKKHLFRKDIDLTPHKSILKYIFSFSGIILLLCILSSLDVISRLGDINPEVEKVFNQMKFLNLARIVRFFAVLTIFSPFRTIFSVFKKQRKVLINVLLISLFLIVIFALVIWNAEATHLADAQEKFLKEHSIQERWIAVYNIFKNTTFENEELKNAWLSNRNVTNENMALVAQNIDSYNNLSNGYVLTFVDALYFASITLTTIGYGDFLPHANISKIIVTINSLLALAIIAIPSGVIASEFLAATQEKVSLKKKSKEAKKEEIIKEVKHD